MLSGSTLHNLEEYFAAIQEDGDWLNDMLMHIPQQLRGLTMAFGKFLAPTLEGTKGKIGLATTAPAPAKAVTVNISSPKALDVREANKEFTKTMNRMALMW
jgi:hypothetical protein